MRSPTATTTATRATTTSATTHRTNSVYLGQRLLTYLQEATTTQAGHESRVRAAAGPNPSTFTSAFARAFTRKVARSLGQQGPSSLGQQGPVCRTSTVPSLGRAEAPPPAPLPLPPLRGHVRGDMSTPALRVLRELETGQICDTLWPWPRGPPTPPRPPCPAAATAGRRTIVMQTVLIACSSCVLIGSWVMTAGSDCVLNFRLCFKFSLLLCLTLYALGLGRLSKNSRSDDLQI